MVWSRIRWSLFLSLAAALLVSDAGSTGAQADGEVRPPVELVGQLGGFVSVIAIEGHHAYVAVGPRLVVLDISDASPRRVGTTDILPIHGPFHYLVVSGDTVFAAIRGTGIHAIDVSTPERPVYLGAIDGYSSGPMAAASGHLFVAQGTDVVALDVADPTAVRKVSTTQMYARSSQVLHHDGLLYVVMARGGGLFVLDVRDPASARFVGGIEEIDIRNVAVAGETVFVTAWEERAHPTFPELTEDIQSLRAYSGHPDAGFDELGRIEFGGNGRTPSADDLDAVEGRVYVSVQHEVIVVDAHEPAALVVTSRFDTPPSTAMGAVNPYPFESDGRMTASGQRLFVTFNEYGPEHPHGGQSGVAVYDLSMPTSPAEVGAWGQDVPNNVEELAVAEGLLYVSQTPASRVRVYDIADPKAPRQVSDIEVDTCMKDFAVADDRVLILDCASYALHVVDMSDPARPALLARRELWRATAVELRGDYVYAAMYGPGETGDDVGQLAILRLTADGRLEDIYRLEGLPRAAHDMVLRGRHLLLAHRSQDLTVIDVGDPSAPVIVGHVETPGALMGLSVVGDTAYLAAQLPTPQEERDLTPYPTYGGVVTVDISDPSDPRQVAVYEAHLDDHRGNVPRWGVAVAHGHAVLAAAEGYVRVVDVRDAGAPVDAGRIRVPGVVGAAAASGDYVYVAGSGAGLLVLRVNSPAGSRTPKQAFLPSVLRGR